jgi:hypothetical protein
MLETASPPLETANAIDPCGVAVGVAELPTGRNPLVRTTTRMVSLTVGLVTIFRVCQSHQPPATA